MRNILRLAFANIRKNKSQSFSFFIIVLISALLLTLGLITQFDYPANFEQKAKQLSAPDSLILTQNTDTQALKEFEAKLQSDSRLKKLDTRPILFTGSEYEYSGGIQTRNAVFINRDQASELGKFTMIDESSHPVEHPIYLPYVFGAGGNYKIDDTFKITLYSMGFPKTEYSFTVAGFYEDIYFSTINSTSTGYLLDTAEYQSLSKHFNGNLSATQYAIKLKSPDDAEAFTSAYSSMLSEELPQGTIIDSNHYALLKSARTVTSSIGATIIVGFSLLILVISLVVVRFRIGNSIEEEMQNIGALKAIGYTSRQIIGTFLMQFTLLAFIASFLGSLLVYPLLPGISYMFAVQTGILWHQSLSLWALGITLLFIPLSIALTAFLSTLRITKLHPIVALRSGVLTHNFRRNPFPLEMARLGLLASLSAKQLFHNLRQNLLIGLIVASVTFAAVFGGALYYNIGVKDDAFLSIVNGETPSLQLEATSKEKAAALLSEIQSNKNIEKAFTFSTDKVTCDTTYEAYTYIVEDFGKTENINWNYQGRFPKYDNEIAINGLLSKAINKKIGDTVTLSLNNKDETYLITGLIQGSNYMGHDLCMTDAGFRRLSPDYWSPTIYAYINDEGSADAFISDIEDSSNLAAYIDINEVIRSSMSAYKMIVGILAIIIDCVTVAIITLVLYLVIKTMILRKKQDFGIQKALGFTTAQLAFQNTLSLFPIIGIGAFGGCILGYFGLNSFLSLLFSSIGMMRVHFIIPPALLAFIFLAICLIGFCVSLIVSLRIRKITPYALMSE